MNKERFSARIRAVAGWDDRGEKVVKPQSLQSLQSLEHEVFDGEKSPIRGGLAVCGKVRQGVVRRVHSHLAVMELSFPPRMSQLPYHWAMTALRETVDPSRPIHLAPLRSP